MLLLEAFDFPSRLTGQNLRESARGLSDQLSMIAWVQPLRVNAQAIADHITVTIFNFCEILVRRKNVWDLAARPF